MCRRQRFGVVSVAGKWLGNLQSCLFPLATFSIDPYLPTFYINSIMKKEALGFLETLAITYDLHCVTTSIIDTMKSPQIIQHFSLNV